jgi:hypothetical protein
VTAPLLFSYQNRLSKTVVKRGGMSAKEAISSAEAQVEMVRGSTLAQIDVRLQEIRDLADRLKANPAADVLPELYVAANRIVGTAGVFGLGDLGEAAYSLCETANRLRTAGRIDWPLIDVHVRALEFLRQPDAGGPAHRQAMLNGLLRVATSAG